MLILILGLVIFLGLHSLRLFADGWRQRQIARLGALRWKGIYSLVAAIGLMLIVWGFGWARQTPIVLYVSPLWLRHLNALFTLAAFILLAAAYVPRNHFKAKVGHPMLLAVKCWAFGHLLANGMLHDALLFGAFLLWAIALFPVSRRRDRQAGTTYPLGTWRGTTLTVLSGMIAWTLVAFWLHRWLFGVAPLG